MSGLPSGSRLLGAAEVLEREGFADVAGVLRLAAKAEKAVRAYLGAPGGLPVGRLTNALPGLLGAFLGRLPLFYSPTVAFLLSSLGTRRAKGEPEAFAKVAEALAPRVAGKRKRLAERDRDREDLAYALYLVSDLKRLNAETRGIRDAEEILWRASDPTTCPELAVALAYWRRRGAGKIPRKKLAAWAWNRTRGRKGDLSRAATFPDLTYDKSEAKLALVNLEALEERVRDAESARDSARKSDAHEEPLGASLGGVETAATPQREGDERNGRKAHEHRGPRRGASRPTGEHPAHEVGRVGAEVHKARETRLVRPDGRSGMAGSAEAHVHVRPGPGGLRKRRPPP